MVPLVDHGELHQQDEGRHNIVEVVLAVAELSKGGSVEENVPTEEPAGLFRASTKVPDLSLKQLHPHHGKGVVHHLEQEERGSEGKRRQRRNHQGNHQDPPG